MPGRGRRAPMTRMARVGRYAFLLATLAVSVAAAAPPEAPLADAAKRADWATVRGLLQQGADVNAPRGDGSTALHWASYWDNREIADLLIRARAESTRRMILG